MAFLEQFKAYTFPNFGMVRLPEVKVPDEEKTKHGLPKNASNQEFLAALSLAGYESKKHLFNPDKLDRYRKQIDFELNIVEELGFTDYFLLVWLVINKSKQCGAFIDYGRGSAAASLIFWLIGITGVDPIDKELIFARFISKVRAKKKVIDGITYIQGDLAPDVDINIGGVRNEIVAWLNEIYIGKMAKISTINTLTGKILVKDVYKTVLDVSEEEAKRVADLVEKHSGIVEDLEKMPEKNKDFKDWSEKYPVVYQTALKLQYLIRQKSTHASGYLLSFYPLDGFVPMEFGKEQELTVGYDMKTVCNVAIKLDLLGLTTNEILKDIQENISEDLTKVNLDSDPLIYDQFQNGTLLPYGLYQISADCAYRVLSDIKPKHIYELSDVNAIARPGALAYLEGYTKHEAQCPHPIFKDILGWTRNFCLYQEQMMQMAVALGFTSEESELLRRVVGKKKVDEVKNWKDLIYQKVQEKGIDKSIGDLFWKILDDSSKYSFNLAHSLSTSYLSALTVYLKYKYPLQFYVACLKSAKRMPNPTEHITLIQKELKFFGIKLLPPDILKSKIDFSIDGNNILYGLGQIKGIAEKTIEKLNAFRHPHANKFAVFCAAEEAKLSVGVLSVLIQSGCLDEFVSKSRSHLVMEAQLWRLLKVKEKQAAIQLAEQFNYNLIQIVKHLKDVIKDDKGKPIIKESRYGTIKKHYQPYKEIWELNSKNESLANYFYETQLLGFSYSENLKEIFEKISQIDLMDIEEVIGQEEDTYVKFPAQVEKVVSATANNEKKTRYFKLTVKDQSGMIDTLMFNDKIEDHKEDNGRKAKEGDIVIVQGRRKKDAVFANHISIQDYRIYTRLSELKDKNKLTEEEKPNNIEVTKT